MRLLLRCLAGAAGAYAIGWSASFVVFVGDMPLVPQYLRWSLTGGGERAAYLQLFALVAIPFGVLAGVFWHLSTGGREGH